MPQIARPSSILRLLALLGSALVAFGILGHGTRVGAQANPAVVGEWSALAAWPAVSVHAAVLPTGKVLFYPYTDEPRLWDPATNTFSSAGQAGFNLFCSGLAFLADGRLLVAGGHISNDVGLDNAAIYDPVANSWTRLPNMNGGRWYPTTTTLADGSALVISGNIDQTVGVNQLPQVLTNGTWRDLTTAQLSLPYYPFMMLAPNGQVFYAGPEQLSRYLDTRGTGTWTNSATSSGGYRTYGTAVMYEPGKILMLGGADPPIASAEVIDLNQQNPAWQQVGSMSSARRQVNSTVLPDGSVLVTGGSSGSGFDNADAPVYTAERWDPSTRSFTTLASASEYRGYHSIALLLPDGRVLSSGGDGEPNAQIFSPPYLFKGARPRITSAPATLVYNQSFQIVTPDAAAVTGATLVRLSAVTHAFNMNQRFLRLPFSQGSGMVTATAPSAPELAPPGDYMLFLLNGNGVPSVASMVRIGPGPPPVAPSSLAAAAPSSNRVNLTWTDNANTELGFLIERSSDGTSFTQRATLGANSTSYSDPAVSASTEYWYRVRAYNAIGSSAFAGPATVTTPASDGQPIPPLAAFAFSEGTGATATDASSNHNNGTISNPSWTTGKYGAALAFNGVDTAVSIPDSNGSLDTGTITVEAWLYKTGATTQYSGIVGRQTGTSWFDSWVLFYDSAAFDDAYRFCALACVTGPSSTPDMNTWVHLAATEDGTTTRLYRNGVLVASSPAHSGALAPEATQVCIGSGANDASLACNSEFVKARIDDVRIYGQARTLAEIQSDMSTAVGTISDAIAPNVALTAPANGATVTGTVQVTASAADNTGVAGVQFALDGSPLGAEDTAAPFAVSWNSTTAINGSHALTAIARDAAGNATTSAVITVTTSNVDKTPPVITAVAPSETAATTATIAWTTNEGADSQVEYGVQPTYGNSTVLNTSLITSHAVRLNGLAPATLYNARVKSRDAAGNLATSANITFTTPALPDVTVPTVALSAPANGATVSGVVQVTATASDNVGVAGVQFKQGATNIGAEDTSAPYAVAWNSAALTPGSYTLTAVARDAAGNTATSTPITVQVTAPVLAPAVASYAFSEGSGATTSDLSVNHNTGTISNPSWTTGKYGSALAFNGASTAVSIPDTNNSLDVSTLTVEAWIYKTAASVQYNGIVGRQTGTSWFDSWVLFYDNVEFSDAYRFCALACVTGPSSTGDRNTWVHLAATEDGTTTRLYRNGVLVASSPAHSGSLAPENTKVCIGAGANDASLACNSEFVNARIDDVRIYGRALGAAEIQSDMNTAVGTVPDPAPPTVSLQQPAGGGSVSGSTVAVSATASDNIGVVGVQFSIDGADLGVEDLTAPYAITWNTTTAANGTHILSALARDAAGNTTRSAAVTVTVTNVDATPPTVALSAPPNGAIVAGTVKLTATAADNVGIIGVQFKQGTTTIGAEDTSAPYTVSWNASALIPGSYTLTAVARDPAGNVTTSAPITVQVVSPAQAPPVAAFAFSEGSGATAGDASSSGNTGTISNPSWVAGKTGSALAFNGVNTAVSIPDTNDSFDSGTLTVEAWVYKTGATTEYNGIVGRQTGTSWFDSWVLFYDKVDFNDAYRFCALACVTGPSSTADLNTWVHLAATENGTTTRLYRNGVLVASSPAHTGSLAPESTKVCIGSGANDATLACNSEFVSARIDDVRIYGRALALAEIQSDMNTAVGTVADVTLPTVSVSAPAAGATVAGSVTLSATASDNVGVAGVQFKVDGANIGAEDTSAPYSISWNTTGLTNGTHQLTAVARDAAGNTKTSAAVTVTVANAAPPAAEH